MHDERRQLPRVPFQGKAFLTYEGRCRQEEVSDVSAEGLSIRTSARLRIGRAVKVFLPIPVNESFRLCLLKGKVVRRRQGRLGIALSPGEIDTRAMLAHWVGALT